MRPGTKFLLQLGLVALIALVFTAAPGGGRTLDVLLTILSIAFFVAIALFAERLWRQQRFNIESLDDRARLVLYASIGGAFLTFAATRRLFDLGGGGVLIWLAILGICSYGVYWVWRQATSTAY